MTYRDRLTIIKISNTDKTQRHRMLYLKDDIDIEVDGVEVGGGIDVQVESDVATGYVIRINGARPLYRTQVYFNDRLMAEDQGLVYENDMSRVKVKP